jgi:hypothetical protein
MQHIVVWGRPAVEADEDARTGGSFIEPHFIRC